MNEGKPILSVTEFPTHTHTPTLFKNHILGNIGNTKHTRSQYTFTIGTKSKKLKSQFSKKKHFLKRE